MIFGFICTCTCILHLRELQYMYIHVHVRMQNANSFDGFLSTCLLDVLYSYEPKHEKKQQNDCAPNKDTDQPGLSHSLISRHCPPEEGLGPQLFIKRTRSCEYYVFFFLFLTDCLFLSSFLYVLLYLSLEDYYLCRRHTSSPILIIHKICVNQYIQLQYLLPFCIQTYDVFPKSPSEHLADTVHASEINDLHQSYTTAN